VLRHDAERLKLQLDAEGYVAVTELLRSAPFRGAHTTLDELQRVVAECPKQRFSLQVRDGAFFIRANQGHSIAVNEDKLLTPLTSAPPLVFHGTYHAPLAAITTQGLSRMSRTHIHFATGFDAVSGIRASCTVLIVVDVRRALADGLKFFTSANGVVLTSGNAAGFLEPKYFAAILDAKTRKPLSASAAFDFDAHQRAQSEAVVAAAADDDDDDDVDNADDADDARKNKKSKK
jgi:2'-phosphotransferase